MAHHFAPLAEGIPPDDAADFLFSSFLAASYLPLAASADSVTSSTLAPVCRHRCLTVTNAPHRRGDAFGRYRDNTVAGIHNRSWKLHSRCNIHCPVFQNMPLRCTPAESTALVSDPTAAEMTDVGCGRATTSESLTGATASSASALVSVSSSASSSSSSSAGAFVSYSVGLNVYTSELLFQHARELLGQDSVEFQTASSALQTFFRQLETVSAKARLAPPRPSPFISFKRGVGMRNAISHSPHPAAQPASAHSAAAAASVSAATSSSSSSWSCAAPHLQKPAYLQYALSQLGVGFQHAEFHGFIAYRHDVMTSGEAWGSVGADVLRDAGSKLGIKLFLDKEDMRVEKWNSQIECVIKGCKVRMLDSMFRNRERAKFDVAPLVSLSD